MSYRYGAHLGVGAQREVGIAQVDEEVKVERPRLGRVEHLLGVWVRVRVRVRVRGRVRVRVRIRVRVS